jgi:Dolichyl-phosphate-mannose-protein mannosyltransferase
MAKSRSSIKILYRGILGKRDCAVAGQYDQAGVSRDRHRQASRQAALPRGPGTPWTVAFDRNEVGAGWRTSIEGRADLNAKLQRPMVRPTARTPDLDSASARTTARSTGSRTGMVERLLCARGWPLSVVLAAQAALSLRLVRSATAFIDEGEYLTVGHLELAHFLHHAAVPDFATYLSGSPVVYPPLAAVADNIGGLAGARLLSLAFMLLTTVLLHGVTRRLMSSRLAAFFAAGLFAWLGVTQFLGAFATYDAMALAFLALATWLGVRAVEASSFQYTLIFISCVALIVADATKYASVLFNPVVIAAIALRVWQVHGRRIGLAAAGAMTLAAGVLLTGMYHLAGRSYAQGISATTLSRTSGTDSIRSVLDLSAKATGIIAALAVLGAVVCALRSRSRPGIALACVLAAAEFLAPAEQARIHTLTSVFKHIGYGAWFACPIAGYLLAETPITLSRLGGSIRRHPEFGAAVGSARVARVGWGLALSAAVVLLAGFFGAKVADDQYGDWAPSRTMIADLARVLVPGGNYLVEDPSVVTYYLRREIPFPHVADTWSFAYADPRTARVLVNQPAYADAIRHGYFAAIVLNFGDTYILDQTLVQDIAGDHDYRLMDVIPYRTSYGPSEFKIWVRVPHRSRARRVPKLHTMT